MKDFVCVCVSVCEGKLLHTSAPSGVAALIHHITDRDAHASRRLALFRVVCLSVSSSVDVRLERLEALFVRCVANVTAFGVAAALRRPPLSGRHEPNVT